MKRVLLSITGTVAAIVALLQFKTTVSPALSVGALPSAGLGASSAATTPSASTSAPSTSRLSTSAPSSSAATTRSATGAAEQTQYGVVQVKVTEVGTKITNVQFVQLTAFDGRSRQINQQAAPVLLQETLAAQSANIDGVSGATFTSEGYLASLQNALDQL